MSMMLIKFRFVETIHKEGARKKTNKLVKRKKSE